MADLPLQTLLRDTSRSFYLTMRVWPAAIRPQVSIAYLLARTTDTIADTELVPVEARLRALAELREWIMGRGTTSAELARLAPNQNSPPERLLLERVEEAVGVLQEMSPEDGRLIREVLTTIIGGQELDLQRFRSGGVAKLAALETEEELDDYAYRVAGCVGEFLTRLFRAHLFPRVSLNEKELVRDGIRFGKGLQMVNILRDIPADLRNGRCYMPRQSLAAIGLQPEDLLSAANEPKFRALYDSLLDRTVEHLRVGWNYINALPGRQTRVRLGCAWCILIGARTVRLLRERNVLDSAQRIKISRAELRGIIFRSLLGRVWPRAWPGQLNRELTGRSESRRDDR